MTRKKLIVMKFALVSIIFFLVLRSSSGVEVVQRATPGEASGKATISESLSKIDTLSVIHFHPTIQCSCCINVGSFARKGLERFYAKSQKDSIIVFEEYDIDQDSSTAKKYSIFWSALGFERLRAGKKEFREIESVWEFCEDEERFLVNFKRELDEFIAASKEAEPVEDATPSESKSDQ